MNALSRACLPALILLACGAACAQNTVKEPWVRGTVAGQKASGFFAQITAERGGKLVAASPPVAGLVEIHEMRMDGSTMRMRAVPALDLPAGKAVALEPGGFHIMLLELKQTLKAGDTVPVTLVIEAAGGQRENVLVQAQVRALGAAPAHQGHKH